ncbi:MAG: endonuclease/exonuclease/phosphatase family protein [Nanoarchaeota archaeon]|nr:endonuclease/exonuclease/phosphatase family protein [Nanoarchaeota archaeon]
MEIKIFNLNCWLLPFPISVENKKRIEKIISLLKKIDPDVITFQEVWLKKYVKKIKNELPQYHFLNLKTPLFNKSGLLFGSKFKPLSFKGEFFPTGKSHNLREKIGLKGYQMVEILPELYVLNTQLYAPEKKSEIKITLSQLNHIEKVIGGKKVILSGDLNLDEEIFLKLNKTFNYSPLGKFTLSNKNKYTKKALNRFYQHNRTIDYIMGTKVAPKLEVNMVNPVEVSDHYAMVGKFKF